MVHKLTRTRAVAQALGDDKGGVEWALEQGWRQRQTLLHRVLTLPRCPLSSLGLWSLWGTRRLGPREKRRAPGGSILKVTGALPGIPPEILFGTPGQRPVVRSLREGWGC